jgi:hypothetical protein
MTIHLISNQQLCYWLSIEKVGALSDDPEIATEIGGVAQIDQTPVIV